MGVIVPSYGLSRDAFIIGEEPWALVGIRTRVLFYMLLAYSPRFALVAHTMFSVKKHVTRSYSFQVCYTVRHAWGQVRLPLCGVLSTLQDDSVTQWCPLSLAHQAYDQGSLMIGSLELLAVALALIAEELQFFLDHWAHGRGRSSPRSVHATMHI